MGNQNSRKVKCLVYGESSTYIIEEVFEIRKRFEGKEKKVAFRPIVRMASETSPGLDLGYEWLPLDAKAFFQEGATCNVKSSNVPAALLQVLERATGLYDGREDMLFMAFVDGQLNRSSFKPPTVLLITSLGAVMLVRTESKAGFGGPEVLFESHVFRLLTVRCPANDSGVLSFTKGERQKDSKGRTGPTDVLLVHMPLPAMAQLVGVLQLIHGTCGLAQLGYELQVNAVPPVAEAVGKHIHWLPPTTPPDGGFASKFAAHMVSENSTVRSDSAQSLGARYFQSLPLLKLDLTDMTPRLLGTAHAAANAWRGNQQFRAFVHNSPFPVDVYASALSEAPLLELDIADARLNEKQVETLAAAIQTNPYGSLLSLDLSGTTLNGKPGMVLAHSLDQALPNPPEHSFRSIRLSNCGLDAKDDGSAKLLMCIGHRSSHIEVLDLSHGCLSGNDPDLPSLRALSKVWASPALRVLNLSHTEVDLAAVLPHSSGLPARRPNLQFDISGGSKPIDAIAASRFAVVSSTVKDLKIIASNFPADQGGGSPVCPLLATTPGPLPGRKVELEMMNCTRGIKSMLEGACQQCAPRDSITITIGYSPTFTSTGGLTQNPGESNLPTLVDGAPASLRLYNAIVCDRQELQEVMDCTAKLCLSSYDPKLMASYGNAALLVLGVALQPPKSPNPAAVTAALADMQSRMGGTLQTIQQRSRISRVFSAAEELRKILEANIGIESLSVTPKFQSGMKEDRISISGLLSGMIPIEFTPCAGPFLVRALQGLAVNKTLLELDISGNCMGDVGAITLGRALRMNRTLRSLSMDGNYTTVAGWSSFRGCLYGNKKLTKFVYPEFDVKQFVSYLGQVTSKGNEAVLAAKAAIKRAYKSTKGVRTAYVLQTQAQEVEKICAAKRNIGTAKRMQIKLQETLGAIAADVKRNLDLFKATGRQEKEAKPIWREARAVLRRMVKIEEKRLAVAQEEKTNMWQKQFKLWQDWRTKVAALSQKAKDGSQVDVKWFTELEKHKSQKKDDVNGVDKVCLSAEEAKALLASVPNELQSSLSKEIEKTRDMLLQEQVKQTKVDSQTAQLESGKLSLQALVQDPAWVTPSEDSGFEDVLDGLRRFGVATLADKAPLPFTAPPPQLFVPSAPPREDTTPQATDPGLVCMSTPAASPLQNSVARELSNPSPEQAAVQYNMYQVHCERVAQRENISGAGRMGTFQRWQEAWRKRRQRQRQEEEARRQRRQQEGLRSSDGYYYGYEGGGYGLYGWGGPYYGAGYYDYGCYDHYYGNPWYSGPWHSSAHEPWNDNSWDMWNGFRHTDPPIFPADGAMPLDQGSPDQPGDKDHHDDPDPHHGDGADPVADDHGDVVAGMYGGGEEPPLPDGGGDEPFPCRPIYCRCASTTYEEDDEFKFDSIAASLRQAELEAMQEWFGTLHENLPYVKERDVLQTSKEAVDRGSDEVCLVTQCSVDRFDRLRSQCMAWAPGICSCAVFLDEHRSRSQVVTMLSEIHAACAKQGGCLVASLVYALPAAAAATPYDKMYPVNTLRNVAMEEASSDLIFILDVDFIPSRHLHATLCSHGSGMHASLSAGARPPCALIVPAFEVHQKSGSELPLPRNFNELVADKRKISPFHVSYFPKGHSATDFARWFNLSAAEGPNCWSYEVAYEEFFEPYVVLNRKLAPCFDERFRGYGLNKCSFLRHLHALGFRFEVLVEGGHFVAAAEHKRSASWYQTYGPDADPAQALKIALLWRIFLRELPQHVSRASASPNVTSINEVMTSASSKSCRALTLMSESSDSNLQRSQLAPRWPALTTSS